MKTIGFGTLVLAALGCGSAVGQGMTLTRQEATVMVEPYAPNVVRVSISLLKDRTTAAPGYGMAPAPSYGMAPAPAYAVAAPGYRTVVNLYMVEGYTHKEIGEFLNISEEGSRSQLHRARILLKKMLTEN